MEQNFAQTREIRYANVSSDERTMAILCHVLSIFFSFIPALVIYLVKKDDSFYDQWYTGIAPGRYSFTYSFRYRVANTLYYCIYKSGR